MEQITIKLPKTKKPVEEMWKVCKEWFKEDAFKRLGWEDKEIYFGDIFRYGMSCIAEDPFAFAQQIRDEKDPMFKEEVEEDKIKKEFEKVYA